MTKGIVFYTDNQLDPSIAAAVQRQLSAISATMQIPIVCSSLEPMVFGDCGVCYPSLQRGVLTMFKQILGGLERSSADVIFLCEHDVLYHPSHFDFTPARGDVYYYNLNVWKVNVHSGKSIHVDDCKQTSGLCAQRALLLTHYRERVRRVEAQGFTRAMGFEPGTHGRPERVDTFRAEGWQSEYPNLDLRHGKNLTVTRWSPEQFRNRRFAAGWQEQHIENIPGWSDVRRLWQSSL